MWSIGFAGVTQFSVSCRNWVSSDGGSSTLTYSYSIGPRTATDDSERDIFYYGASPDSGQMTLSLGNSLDDFRSKIVARITDSNGDFIEYESPEIKASLYVTI